MSTARLPVPGSDDNTWGTILNDFLEVSLNGDGTLQVAALTQAGGELTGNKGQANGYAALNGSGIVPSAQLGSGSAGSTTYLRGDGSWATPTGSPDATTNSVGLMELSGDLGGSATDPSVLKVNGVTISGTPSSGQVITATNGTNAAWSEPDNSAAIAFAVTFG